MLQVCHVASEFKHQSQMLCMEERAMQTITHVVEGDIPQFHGRSNSSVKLHQLCTIHFFLPHRAIVVRTHLCSGCLHIMAGGAVVTRPGNFLNNASGDVICQSDFWAAFIPVCRLHGSRLLGSQQVLHDGYSST
jgi:hypothetical protein